MPGDKLYANAQIITYSDAKLLTRKRIREMIAAPDRATLLDSLAKCDYQIDFTDDTALLAAAQAKTLQTFLELCDDVALATCVQAWNQLTESNVIETFQTFAINVPKIKAANIREYFTTLADFINVRTYLKGGTTMVTGGTLTLEQLHHYHQADINQVTDTYTARLNELAAVDKDDIFKINPLFWWYTQKQNEFTVVKTILMAKRFNYDTIWLRNNLRGLYDQFQ